MPQAVFVPNPAFTKEAAHLPTMGVALRVTAEDVASNAKESAPVLTGALRESIHAELEHEPSGYEGVVVADVPYAAYVEFGTSRQDPQPFLRLGLEEA